MTDSETKLHRITSACFLAACQACGIEPADVREPSRPDNPGRMNNRPDSVTARTLYAVLARSRGVSESGMLVPFGQTSEYSSTGWGDAARRGEMKKADEMVVIRTTYRDAFGLHIQRQQAPWGEILALGKQLLSKMLLPEDKIEKRLVGVFKEKAPPPVVFVPRAVRQIERKKARPTEWTAFVEANGRTMKGAK